MLLYRLFLRNATGAHQIPFVPSKTVIPPPSPGALVPVPPEEVGIDSAYVDDFLTALEGERSASMHAVAAARGGKLFCLASAPGYDYTLRHQTHSLCKTVTGLCIGILLGEGRIRLDTPAYKLIPTGLPARLSLRTKAITVRHLLTMTTGVMFAEVGSVTESDWVRSFFESSVTFVPGTRFAYNSMNSYILSVIVEAVTGMTLLEFANERIFHPLGIRDVFWEACPRGHTKGGWGLYLSVEDCLKLGEMILGNGMYHRRRIVPREWIYEMAKPHAKAPEVIGDYNYGYHIWVARDGKSLLCNGMLGQNIWISPKNRLVLVTSAANCELFQNGPMFSLFKDTFSLPFGEGPKPPNEQALAHLREHEASFFAGRTWSHPTDPRAHLGDRRVPSRLFEGLTRAPYLAERNNFGLLPLFVMLTQNNLSAGIQSLAFRAKGEERTLILTEGEEVYTIPLGFKDYRETSLTVRGERYLVRARAEFCDDTDGVPILKIELLFPELASARRMRLYYDDAKPTVVLSEQPGRRMLDYLVDVIDFMPRGKLLSGLIRSQLEREMIEYRVRTCYEPTLRLGRGEAPVEVEYSRFDGSDPSPFTLDDPLAFDEGDPFAETLALLDPAPREARGAKTVPKAASFKVKTATRAKASLIEPLKKHTATLKRAPGTRAPKGKQPPKEKKIIKKP